MGEGVEKIRRIGYMQGAIRADEVVLEVEEQESLSGLDGGQSAKMRDIHYHGMVVGGRARGSASVVGF